MKMLSATIICLFLYISWLVRIYTCWRVMYIIAPILLLLEESRKFPILLSPRCHSLLVSKYRHMCCDIWYMTGTTVERRWIKRKRIMKNTKTMSVREHEGDVRQNGKVKIAVLSKVDPEWTATEHNFHLPHHGPTTTSSPGNLIF